jgi:cytochrome P450
MPTDSTMPTPGRLAFNLDDLKLQTGAFGRLLGWALRDPRWAFALLRRWPRAGFKFSDWVLVTRFDDVREVLTQDQVFEVPYGDKAVELIGGTNFLLGMQRSELYWRYQQLVMKAFRFDEAKSTVPPLTFRLAQELLDAGDGEIDAVEGLLTRVAVLISRDYFGVPISDLTEFGHWMIAMSTHVFVDAATVVPPHKAAADAAAQRVRAVVDEAIALAKKGVCTPGTVLARLVEMQKSTPDLEDNVIRSFLIGMILGFVPTDTVAAGNILEIMLERPQYLARAKAAARAGDDDLLQRCLFEALRFKHIHWGLTRICKKNYTIAAGSARATAVRPGAKVLASTWAAMFDGNHIEHPNAYDPGRQPADYMLLGYAMHWCIGAFIAYAHVTQTFKALLLREDLRPMPGAKGKMQYLGFFPQHLWMRFKA